MKTLKHLVLKNKDGTDAFEETTKEILTTKVLTRLCLEQTKYKNNGELWKASTIVDKITAAPKGKDMELEDAEFEFLKEKVEQFPPFLTGLKFIPIMELFDPKNQPEKKPNDKKE